MKAKNNDTSNQRRLDERNTVARRLADKMPAKTGMSEIDKMRAVRLHLAVLEAENLIKHYLPHLQRLRQNENKTSSS